MGRQDLVEFCGELRHETDNAYLIFDGESEVWIPKSQCEEARQIGGSLSKDYEFIIPEWLAIEKGIV